MTWIVVKFTDSEEVEAVPHDWLDKNTNILLYPNFNKTSHIIRAIKTQQIPDEENWKKFQVVLMRNGEAFDSLEKASKKAAKACLTSDVSDGSELPVSAKRIPKKKVFSSGESDSSSEGLSDSPPLPPYAPKGGFQSLQFKKKKTVAEKKVSTSASQHLNQASSQLPEEALDLNNLEKSFDDTVQEKSHTIDMDDTDTKFKKAVLSLLNKISKQIGGLEMKIINLNAKIDQQINQQVTIQATNEDMKTIYADLPISSEETLRELENKLISDQNIYDFLVDSLQKIGGSNFKEATRRIFKQFLSDKVAINYSLKGHKAKKSFITLKFCDLILDAVQKCSKTTRKEIEVSMGIYLSKAGERLKKLDEGDGANNVA